MLSRRLLLVLLCSSACSAQPEAQTPAQAPAAAPTSARAEAVIVAALAQQADAWNRHDARAWVAPFADDAEFVNVLGMLLQGKPEIEKRHDEIFRGIFARSRVVVTTRKVRLLGSAAALAETDYELRDYDRLPPGIRATEPDGTLRTRLKYVWALTSDGWRILAAQNTAILPLPPGPPGE